MSEFERLVCATYPGTSLRLVGIGGVPAGLPASFVVAGVGMGCLQWSSGPLCMSPSRRITALPPLSAPAPCQERDHLPWHHGSWPEASRTGAQGLPTVVGESLPVVLSWCLGAGHVNTTSPPFTPTSPIRSPGTGKPAAHLRREPFTHQCWGDQHPRAQFSRGGVVGRFRRK